MLGREVLQHAVEVDIADDQSVESARPIGDRARRRTDVLVNNAASPCDRQRLRPSQ